ncbi:hypothetical protein [uncultured Draconibacterium sp.]|uniref:hypothetical protein n=1 Tax=uncultured Draconibacterium sp. TaxID=1573823 RepID=UPI0032164112
MKRILAFLFLGLFVLNVQAQWYTKSFGAENISDLNEAQLNYLLQRAQSNIKTGKIATYSGAGAFVFGIFLAGSGLNNWVWHGGDENQLDKFAAGSLLMVTGMGAIAVGVPFWIVGENRKKKVEIALIQMKYSSGRGYSQEPLGLGVRIRF